MPKHGPSIPKRSSAHSSWPETFSSRTRYVLADPGGREQIFQSLQDVKNEILKGRLLLSSLCSQNGSAFQPLGAIKEWAETIESVWPRRVQKDSVLEGVLELDSLVECLTYCARNHLDGRLFLCDPSHPGSPERVVVFHQGHPQAMRSSTESELLGNFAVFKGYLAEEDLRAALRDYPKSDLQIGQLLCSQGKISEKKLQQLISLQLVERLLQIFRDLHGNFRFVPGEIAGEPLQSVLSVRDLIDLGVKIAVRPDDWKRRLPDDSAFDPTPSFSNVFGLSEEDLKAIPMLGSGRPLSECLPLLQDALHWNFGDARRRAWIYLKLGCIRPRSVAAPSLKMLETAVPSPLEQRLRDLQKLDYFELLDLRRSATAEDVETAYQKALRRYGALPEDSDQEKDATARSQIKQLLADAAAVLSNEDERQIYQRALQLGLDHRNPDVQKRIRCENLQAEARALVQKQNYADAAKIYGQLQALLPEDDQVAVEEIWVRFLASPETDYAVQTAVGRLQDVIARNPSLDEAYLTLARIERRAGHFEEARSALDRILLMHPRNLDAQTEMRLLTGARQRKDSAFWKLPQVWGPLIGCLLMFVVLYLGANVAAGGAREWPQVEDLYADQEASAEQSFFAEELVRQQRARFEKEDQNLVPASERVMGNVEFYYKVDDPWWWIRHALLLVLGAIGLLALGREDFSKETLGSRPKWILAAIPYGALTGWFSYIQTPTPLPVVLGMGFFHTLAEQLFFVWFLARLFRHQTRRWILSTGLLGALYAIYQLTFYAVLKLEPLMMLSEVLKLGLFGGAAYALLLHLSGGIIAPFLAQLVMMVVMMTMCN